MRIVPPRAGKFRMRWKFALRNANGSSDRIRTDIALFNADK